MTRDAAFTLDKLLTLLLNGEVDGQFLALGTIPAFNNNGSIPSNRKFGVNRDVSAANAPTDVVSLGAASSYTYPFPSAAINISDLRVVSTSDEDGAGGETGASQVTFLPLDENKLIIPNGITVNLNGTTDVTPSHATATQILRCDRGFIVGPVGSATSNVGTITIRQNGGDTLAQILPLAGQTLMAVTTVPKNYIGANVLSGYATMIGPNNGSAILQFQFRLEDQGWRVADEVGISTNGPKAEGKFEIGDFIPPGADLRVRVISATGNNLWITARFLLSFKS